MLKIRVFWSLGSLFHGLIVQKTLFLSEWSTITDSLCPEPFYGLRKLNSRSFEHQEKDGKLQVVKSVVSRNQ
jgi:hypothetical protein